MPISGSPTRVDPSEHHHFLESMSKWKGLIKTILSHPGSCNLDTYSPSYGDFDFPMPAARPRISVHTVPFRALDVATGRARLEDSRAADFTHSAGVIAKI